MPHHISGLGAPSTLGFDGPTVPGSGGKAPRGGPLEKKEALAHGFPGPGGGCQRVYRISSLGDFREKVSPFSERPC